jgi:cephalosporin hydroxylase
MADVVELPRTSIDVTASLNTFEVGTYEQVIDGIRAWKLPEDLDRYARVIESTRPEVLIETGTKWGGSALWFEGLGLDVVTIDIEADSSRRAKLLDSRVIWITGSSTDPAVVARIAVLVAGRRVMVSLDAEHAAPHVAAEILAYGPLVSPGCYLVVEDGIFDLTNDEALRARGGRSIPSVGGPLHAISQTLASDAGWVRDEDIERLYPVSHHPAGWWVRRA